MKLPNFMLRLLKQFRCRRVFKRWTAAERALDLLPGYTINRGDLIELGVGVHFGTGIFIDARGGLRIGTNVIFAPNVTILTYNHDFRNPDWKPYSPDFLLRKVVIGNHCWIGKNAIILPGAQIGNECVIGAGAVVGGAIAANSILAGNPAKVIGKTNYGKNARQYQVIHGNQRRFG